MSPYELMYAGGALDMSQRSTRPSIDRIKFLSSLFRHSVWLNPARCGSGHRAVPSGHPPGLPMFDLTLDGLEAAVRRLAAKIDR